ncbi:unnamed protein product, partial [Amoebophrya sp. A120]|eukprot:GSA120T00011507001.1
MSVSLEFVVEHQLVLRTAFVAFLHQNRSCMTNKCGTFFFMHNHAAPFPFATAIKMRNRWKSLSCLGAAFVPLEESDSSSPPRVVPSASITTPFCKPRQVFICSEYPA